MIGEVFHLQNGGGRPCGQCEGGTVHVSYETQKFPYGEGKDQVILEAHVPVWSCSSCGDSYTDGDAEEKRHAAICRHLAACRT